MLLDLRHAARLLVSQRAFSVIAIATLAIGIGATTAIFSVVDAVLLRPAPLAGVDRVAVLWETDRQSGTTREPGSLPDWIDYRERTQSFAGLAGFVPSEVNVTLGPAGGGEPERLQAVEVTGEFLSVLGVTPTEGRGLTGEDARPGGPAVVVLGSLFAERLASSGDEPGGRASLVGRVIRLDGQARTVIGILPRDADFGLYQVLRAADYGRSFADRAAHAGIDVFLPLQQTAEELPRSTHPLFMVGRLRGDAASAQREVSAIASVLEGAYRENAARGAFVERLPQIVFAPVRPALLVLTAAVALVLLVACANVANLLLARGTARRREVAVRLAIGASRLQLARQFACEGLLLTLLAGAAGAGLAAYGVRALVALAPADVPRIAESAVNPRVLLVTLGIALASGFVFALVPLFQARRIDLQSAIKSGPAHAGQAGAGLVQVRSLLVVGEFALAVMLVIGATLLIRSFARLERANPGFDASGVLKAEYQLPPDRYPVDFKRFPDFVEMHAFTHRLLADVSRLPGVRSAAVAGNHPIDPGFTNSFVIVGREAESRTFPEVSIRRVTPGYFPTMAVPLVRGRLFRDADSTRAPAVLLLNEAAARRFFAQRDPIGQQVAFWGTSRTIVGIVGDERFHGLAQEAPPAVYAPLDQVPSADGAGVLLVKTEGNPAGLGPAVRGAIRRQDPGLAVFGLEPLGDTLARSVAERRFTMLVLGLLAGVALLLAAAGVHGVLSYTVGQRTRELGIRVALGARPSTLRRLVMLDGLALSAAGAALGVAGALVLTRLLRAMLFGITATDLSTFVAVPAGLCLIALLASYFPARRATRADPLAAIRAD